MECVSDDGVAAHRGYVNTRITREWMTADFRVLDYVKTAGAPVAVALADFRPDGHIETLFELQLRLACTKSWKTKAGQHSRVLTGCRFPGPR